MMKKLFTLCGISIMAIVAQAQTDDKELVSIESIAEQEQITTTSQLTNEHFKKVWGRNGFFNIALAAGGQSLNPLDDIATSITGETVKDRNSKFGAALTLGRNIALHKPIANIVRINMDIEGMLAFNYYKRENDGYYNTDNRNKENDFMMPWNARVYQGGLQMAAGPSVTVAPFTTLENKGLHYFKFNLYWHIGYHGSTIYFDNDKKHNQKATDSDAGDFDKAIKLMWSHGLTSTMGFNVSWKGIGLGYEYWRTMRPVEYKAIESKVFDDDEYRFKACANRIYLQFRF